jgi:hypothetical protein
LDGPLENPDTYTIPNYLAAQKAGPIDVTRLEFAEAEENAQSLLQGSRRSKNSVLLFSTMGTGQRCAFQGVILQILLV